MTTERIKENIKKTSESAKSFDERFSNAFFHIFAFMKASALTFDSNKDNPFSNLAKKINTPRTNPAKIINTGLMVCLGIKSTHSVPLLFLSQNTGDTNKSLKNHSTNINEAQEFEISKELYSKQFAGLVSKEEKFPKPSGPFSTGSASRKAINFSQKAIQEAIKRGGRGL